MLYEVITSIEAKSATIAEFNEEIADINVAIKGYNTALVNARKDSANYATRITSYNVCYTKLLRVSVMAKRAPKLIQLTLIQTLALIV